MTNLAIPVDLIEPGCTVYALSSDDTDADMRSVKGGVVVEIVTNVDPETREVERRFVTATAWRRDIRFDTVNASDVRQADPPNTASIRGLIRTAARVVADAKRFGTSEVRLVRLQNELMEVL